jgi:hypothetical protein
MDEKVQAVRDEIRSCLDENGQIHCESAHRIAGQLGVEPLRVGEQADEIEIRITRCQLGLFGHAAKKGMPGYRLVKKLDNPPEQAAASVKKAADHGKISCLALWRLAAQGGLTRQDMGNIAETLEFKVTPCQLGCF